MGKVTLTITVYKNGDSSDQGHVVKLDRSKFKYIDQALDEINGELEMDGLSHGYKQVFSTNGRKIKDASRLHNDKEYVLAKDDDFIRAPYGKQPRARSAPSDRRGSSGSDYSARSNSRGGRSKSRGGSRAPDHRNHRKAKEKKKIKKSKNRRERRLRREIRKMPDHEDPIKVQFYQNGQINDPGMDTEIPLDALGDYESMMTFVNKKFRKSGQPKIRKIYTIYGDEIIDPKQMEDQGEYVGAASRFIRVTYGEKARELEEHRSVVNSQRQRLKSQKWQSDDDSSGSSTCSECDRYHKDHSDGEHDHRRSKRRSKSRKSRSRSRSNSRSKSKSRSRSVSRSKGKDRRKSHDKRRTRSR